MRRVLLDSDDIGVAFANGDDGVAKMGSGRIGGEERLELCSGESGYEDLQSDSHITMTRLKCRRGDSGGVRRHEADESDMKSEENDVKWEEGDQRRV